MEEEQPKELKRVRTEMPLVGGSSSSSSGQSGIALQVMPDPTATRNVVDSGMTSALKRPAEDDGNDGGQERPAKSAARDQIEELTVCELRKLAPHVVEVFNPGSSRSMRPGSGSYPGSFLIW